MPENRRADAHMRGAELDRCRKIALMPIDRFFSPLRAAIFAVSAKMRRRRLVDRRDAHQAGNHQAIFLTAARNEGVGSPGAMPAFCGSSPVLSWTNNSGCFFCELIPWLTLRKCSGGRPNEWHRTAPRPPWPCWIAAAQSDAARFPGKQSLTPATSPWLPARDFSPNMALSASIIGEIADASKVFDTAINFTVAGSRRASLAARAISAPPWRGRLVKSSLSAWSSRVSCWLGCKFIGFPRILPSSGKAF